MKYNQYFLLTLICIFIACKEKKETNEVSSEKKFSWENATVYFMLTDRFYNGDKTNDFKHPEDAPPAPYRGYMGGDVKGITQKLNEGYFDSLGVNALWMTPLIENNDGSVDEGTGRSYAFHGYWTKDWTAIDKRLGSKEEVREMVKTAHQHGIRVLMDAVINHTGPVTPQDVKWPDEWVKTKPKCEYKDYKSTTNCTLVDNLPDIRTESETEVKLPDHLLDKWKKEGRLEQELKELDEFFAETKYPRRPFYYIVKWLVDLIKDFGIDGFRVDTAKHTEEGVWQILYQEANKAYGIWKKNHQDEIPGDEDFYMVGEVYNYYVSNGRMYDFGDKKVDFYDHGFKALINFDFKSDANKSYDSIFTKYDSLLHGPLKNKTILNYISSHDDGGPFDKERKRSYESATKLMLTQGGVQIYYGDETERSLSVKAQGDAVLRSFMNWDEMQADEKKKLLTHWQKLGRFRNNHISIGAGRHKKLNASPYVFHRNYNNENQKDEVIVALDVNTKTEIDISSVMKEGKLYDKYNGISYEVKGGKVVLNPGVVILLER